ncbi:MAG: AAA family ATPase [Planctomycetota bacterium]
MTVRNLSFAWAEDLAKLPPPEWLVDGILPSQGFVALCSEPGVGKTFLAIDWALSIASGVEWCGRKVTQGPVVYVIAEGGAGIGQRFEAWKVAKGAFPDKSALAVTEPIQLHAMGESTSLIRLIREMKIEPRLVVFDTLAKCFAGGEENSAKDMGLWVDGAFQLQKEFGATVLALHHLTKHTGEVRGSGALKGAADAVVRLKRNAAGIITVECEKQKDAGPFEPFTLETKVVPAAGSLVLVATGAKADAGRTWGIFGLDTLKALATFQEGAKSKEWRLKTGLKERTFHHHRNSLIENKLVTEEGGIYVLTEAGKTATANAMPLAAVA